MSGFFRFIIGTALLAVVVVLGFGVWSNWHKDHDGDGEPDGFTLRVLDPTWWGQARGKAEPMADEAVATGKQLGERFKELAAQTEEWLDRTDSVTGSAGDPLPIDGPDDLSQPVAVDPVAEEPTLHLEDRIIAARARIDVLLELAGEGGVPMDQVERHLRAECRELRAVVPVYAQRQGHDPQLVRMATELRRRGEELLAYGFDE